MKYLVTGVAGFIGMHTAKKLLELGFDVVGIDNLNDYYDVNLKIYRLETLQEFEKFSFIKMDICETKNVSQLFKKEKFNCVIHLAAQAGVRYSIEKPFAYTDSNITGFLSILEACRETPVDHLLYASSSSVYGMNTKIPFSTTDKVDQPVSLYAATKKANELMAHTYSHLYKIPTTGLRFFTVYGPAGRPDMAPWLFTEAILKGLPIKVFNNGEMERDFTYIDDIVEGIIRISNIAPGTSDDKASNLENSAPYKVYNIGNSNTVKLSDFIDIIENLCGKKAKKQMLPMQKGDVKITFADVSELEKITRYKPITPIALGLEKFVSWYKLFHEYTDV